MPRVLSEMLIDARTGGFATTAGPRLVLFDYSSSSDIAFKKARNFAREVLVLSLMR